MPYIAATSWAFALSVSTMPTSSTSHSSMNARMWYWPMCPAPTTPARIFWSPFITTPVPRGRPRRGGSARRRSPHRLLAWRRRRVPAAARRADDAEPRCGDEVGEPGHQLEARHLGPQPLDRRAWRQPGAVEHAEGLLDLAPDRGVDPGAPHPDHVDRAGHRRPAVGDHERRHVLIHLRHAADVGERADAPERVEGGHPPDGGAVFDDAMPGERGAVDHDDVVADDAVVGDVDVRHEQAVAADHGIGGLARGVMDGRVLPDDGVVADADTGGRARTELQVLGWSGGDRAVGGADARAGRHP